MFLKLSYVHVSKMSQNVNRENFPQLDVLWKHLLLGLEPRLIYLLTIKSVNSLSFSSQKSKSAQNYPCKHFKTYFHQIGNAKTMYSTLQFYMHICICLSLSICMFICHLNVYILLIVYVVYMFNLHLHACVFYCRCCC